MTYQEFIQSIKESRENVWFEHSECHHIVPRCMGGTDDWDNLIYLTYREHFIAHKLLVEENPGNRDLILAVHLMSLDGDHETTPEEYAEARKNFSDSQKGNTFGYLCRHTEEFKESLRERNRKGHSTETCEKIRQARTGSKASPETIEALRRSHIGLKMPPRVYPKNCERCNIYFDATSPKVKYCQKCKDELLIEYKSTHSKSESAKNRKCHILCKVCGKEFIAGSYNAKYCSDCR